MKPKLLFAVLLSSIVAFSSCKKDKSEPTVPVAEKKLKKVTKTESGITTVYNLTYNASGKLVSYNSANNAETLNFFYDAAGNLIGLEEKNSDNLNQYLFTYANNVPVSGTYKSWDISGGSPGTLEENKALTYTVVNNKVSKIKLSEAGSPDWSFNLTYTGNNLTKVSSEGIIAFTADFTYGNRKPIFPKVTNYVLDQTGFTLLYAANNEITKVVFDFPGTSNDYTVNNIYTYDSKGYVLTSTDGSVQQTFEYQ